MSHHRRLYCRVESTSHAPLTLSLLLQSSSYCLRPSYSTFHPSSSLAVSSVFTLHFLSSLISSSVQAQMGGSYHSCWCTCCAGGFRRLRSYSTAAECGARPLLAAARPGSIQRMSQPQSNTAPSRRLWTHMRLIITSQRSLTTTDNTNRTILSASKSGGSNSDLQHNHQVITASKQWLSLVIHKWKSCLATSLVKVKKNVMFRLYFWNSLIG